MLCTARMQRMVDARLLWKRRHACNGGLFCHSSWPWKPLWLLCGFLSALTICCYCRPVVPSAASPAGAAVASSLIIFLPVSASSDVPQKAAAELFSSVPGTVKVYTESPSERSNNRNNSKVGKRGAGKINGGEKQPAESKVKYAAGRVPSSKEQNGIKRIQTDGKAAVKGEKQEPLIRVEDANRKQRLYAEMDNLLAESYEYGKLQAGRRANKELQKYADEEGNLDVEDFDAFKEAASAYKRQNKQISNMEIGAVASGSVGAAGLLSLILTRKQKDVIGPEQAKIKRRSSWVMGAVGVLGAMGVMMSLLRRRLLKRKSKLSERRLTRMENEAYAGVAPGPQPVLGLDDIPEAEKRKRRREERRQQQ